jgi:5-formyltetrahydrofolate cyclo-ligase
MFELSGAKDALRKRVMAARDALTPEFRESAARALAAKATLPAFRRLLPETGGIVAGYFPIRSEIDPLPLMHEIATLGYRLALPRIVADGLVFHAYASGDDLAKGPLGTREPLAQSPIVEPETILTPLVAFDIRGARLGYGKGFYDRVFHGMPSTKRIGLGFAMQQVVAVPCELHDAELDAIFTEI